jgi:3-phosphoshikimate 1-carboxyvinyltransferase
MSPTSDKSKLEAEFDIPGSKSLTHRALIIAALAEGRSRIQHALLCDDTVLTMTALRALGATISQDDEILMVSGTGGRLAENGSEIFLDNSGTSMRLLTSVAALSNGSWTLTGNARMETRPIDPLLAALSDLGAVVRDANGTGCPPIKVEGGGIKGGRTRISAAKSSQYLSSLLLSSPFAREDVIIEVIDTVSSWPYVELTLSMMESFGVNIEHRGKKWFRIPAGQGYQAREMTIEGDCSSAAYFWAAAAATGGYVVTRNIKPFSLQPDIHFLDVLKRMGCDVTFGDNWVAVTGNILSSVDEDMNAMPDQVPTLAILAALARGRTTIHNVAHLRYKESDRLIDLTTELRKLGVQVNLREDGLEIEGGALSGGTIDPHQDHRLAMSFAVARLVRPEIEILDPACVSKSFPNFWKLFEKITFKI